MNGMYIARDEDGSLNLYRGKPARNDSEWYPVDVDGKFSECFFELNESLFPEVKWTDKEPTMVELHIVGDKIAE